jgi:cell division transport system ATP-binding protein
MQVRLLDHINKNENNCSDDSRISSIPVYANGHNMLSSFGGVGARDRVTLGIEGVQKDMSKKFDSLMEESIEPPIIVLENVSKAYQKEVDAVKEVNLEIRKGEFVFIVGSSGSGKSTLIKLLLKEIEPTSGKIYVNGKEITRLRRGLVPKFRRNLGIVFQDFRLLKDRNVYENVAFAQRVIEKPIRTIQRNVPAILSVVGLSDKMKAFPKELSGGEQQRVALARALVNNPLILLADEPTGNLDPKNSWDIMMLLEEVNKKGTTVLVVTHNREIVDVMQKRVITMNKGVITSDEQKGGYSHEV